MGVAAGPAGIGWVDVLSRPRGEDQVGRPGAARSGSVQDRRPPLDRQREAEPGAAAGAVLGPDVAAMRLDESPADGQPEARTVPPLDAASAELLEDALGLVRRQPRPAVGYLHRDQGRLRLRGDLERGSRRRVAERVLQEIDQDLLDE